MHQDACQVQTKESCGFPKDRTGGSRDQRQVEFGDVLLASWGVGALLLDRREFGTLVSAFLGHPVAGSTFVAAHLLMFPRARLGLLIA